MKHPLLSLLLIAPLLPACVGGADDDDEEEGDIVGILITPEEVVVPVGQQVQLRATGLTADRESVDLTASADWSSSDEGVLRVSNELDEEGMAVGLEAGSVLVEAEVDGVESPPLTVTVTDADVVRLGVYPDSLDLAPGDSVQLVATAWFSDGSESDASSQVRWVVEDGTVATLSQGGEVTAQGTGSTSLYAEWGEARSDDVPVTVSSSGGSAAGGDPNLTISAASGSISGGVLDLSVTLKNSGDAAASDFWVDVFVDSGTPDIGDIGDDFSWLTYLGAGSTTTLDFQLSVGSGSHDSGSHNIAVLADTNDDVDESSENDNLFTTTVSSSGGSDGGSGDGGSDDGGAGDGGASDDELADLEITYFDFIYDEDYGDVYYYVDVHNSGDAAASEFYVDVWVDRDDAPGLYEDGDDWATIYGLSAGDTTYADFFIEGAWCTWCWSWVMIDGYEQVEESDEGNNVEGPLDVP